MTATPDTKAGSKRRKAAGAPTDTAAQQPVNVTPPPAGGNGNGSDPYALNPELQSIADRLRGKTRSGQQVDRLLVPDWNLIALAEQLAMQYWMNSGRLFNNCVNQYAEEFNCNLREAREQILGLLQENGVQPIELPQWDPGMNSFTNLNACHSLTLAELKAFNKGLWSAFGNDNNAEVQGLASRAQKAASAARKQRQGQTQAAQTVPPVEEDDLPY